MWGVGTTSIHSFNVDYIRNGLMVKFEDSKQFEFKNTLFFRGYISLPSTINNQQNLSAKNYTVTPSVKTVNLERRSHLAKLRFGGGTSFNTPLENNELYVGFMVGAELLLYKGTYDPFPEDKYDIHLSSGRQQQWDINTAALGGYTYVLEDKKEVFIDLSFKFNFVRFIEYLYHPSEYIHYNDYYNVVSITALGLSFGMRF